MSESRLPSELRRRPWVQPSTLNALPELSCGAVCRFDASDQLGIFFHPGAHPMDDVPTEHDWVVAAGKDPRPSRAKHVFLLQDDVLTR